MASGTASTALLLLLLAFSSSASATVAVSDLPDGKTEVPADSDPAVANLAASYIPVKFIHVRLDGPVAELAEGQGRFSFLRRQSAGGSGRKLLHLRKLADLGADNLQGKERKLVVRVRRMGPDCGGSGDGMMGGGGGMMGGGGGEGGGNDGGSARRFSILTDRQ